VVLVVVAAVVVVAGNRSSLDHARTRIDARWTPLRDPLNVRYQRLATVSRALATDLGSSSSLPKRLDDAIARWNLRARTDDTEGGVRAANDLEGLAALARVTATSTDRLRGDRALQQAVNSFAAAGPQRATIDAYNAAVHAYEHDRTTGIRRVTAAIFGYDARRTFQPAA
jgi:hypothetical protein